MTPNRTVQLQRHRQATVVIGVKDEVEMLEALSSHEGSVREKPGNLHDGSLGAHEGVVVSCVASSCYQLTKSGFYCQMSF